MWKRGDVVVVTLPGSQIIGRIYNDEVVFSTKIAHLENPFFLRLEPTPNGILPVLSPFGSLLEEPVYFLDIGPNQYIHAGKARRELNVVYSNTEDKFKQDFPMKEQEEVEKHVKEKMPTKIKNIKNAKSECAISKFMPLAKKDDEKDTKINNSCKIHKFTPLK